jgi:hypothetical protein
LSELRALLQALLERLGPMPVLTWISEGQENMSEIGEVVSLMLEVDLNLMKEIDHYVDTTVFMQESSDGGRRSVADPAGDIFDLPPEEGSAPIESPAHG